MVLFIIACIVCFFLLGSVVFDILTLAKGGSIKNDNNKRKV